jgi:hypothetical protein
MSMLHTLELTACCQRSSISSHHTQVLPAQILQEIIAFKNGARRADQVDVFH